jgi:hypothetical protein
MFTLLGSFATETHGQVYGYTDEHGKLVLSNVPSDDRMRLIAEGSAENAGRVWKYSGQYDDVILEAATRARLDSSLVKAVIAVESGFNRFARSHKGAMGLMQLMPGTCRRYGVVNPYDARQNVHAGAIHLRDLLDEFDDLHLSLAAYNAGATPVRKYGRIPPYRETRDYVRKVMAIYRAGSKISITKGGNVYTINRGGRTRVEKAPASIKAAPAETSRITSLDEGVSLAKIAAANRQPARETREYQPAKNTLAGAAKANSARSRTPKAVVVEPSPENQTSPKLPNASTEATPEAEGESDMSSPAFYRYTDDNGVTYITRTKPTHDRYEILRYP